MMRRVALALALGACVASGAHAQDLGSEGPVFEVIEEDLRVVLLRLVARRDWTEDMDKLEQSAGDYTKNLAPYFVPRAEKTATLWKDAGMVTTEDITLPYVDWETGSVFAPERRLAVAAGTYLNPIAGLPAGGIERLFIFDATDAEQLAFARALMSQNIAQLSFMTVAGDPGALSTEAARPIFYPTPDMLHAFHVSAVPTLLGFGRGPHQGHLAVTSFALPYSIEAVRNAWYGLGYAEAGPRSTDPRPADLSAAVLAPSLAPSSPGDATP